MQGNAAEAAVVGRVAADCGLMITPVLMSYNCNPPPVLPLTCCARHNRSRLYGCRRHRRAGAGVAAVRPDPVGDGLISGREIPPPLIACGRNRVGLNALPMIQVRVPGALGRHFAPPAPGTSGLVGAERRVGECRIVFVVSCLALNLPEATANLPCSSNFAVQRRAAGQRVRRAPCRNAGQFPPPPRWHGGFRRWLRDPRAVARKCAALPAAAAPCRLADP